MLGSLLDDSFSSLSAPLAAITVSLFRRLPINTPAEYFPPSSVPALSQYLTQRVTSFGTAGSVLNQARLKIFPASGLAFQFPPSSMPDTVVARRGQIDSDVVVAASELSAVTPAPRRIRVAGCLDLMGASQGVLKVHIRP